MKRKVITGVFAALGMLLLILDAKTALLGAAEGLQLCIQTIIPSLFPFFILSVLLTSSLTGVRTKLLWPVGKLCGMPQGSEILLLTGLLGGYPVGAQGITQAWKDGQLKHKDALRLLGFCSNAGPAFLFGIIAMQFGGPFAPWALWGIHIVSALLVGVLLPNRGSSAVTLKRQTGTSLPRALERSLKITASVCGWVMLFRIVIAFLDRWFFWLFPDPVRILLCGLLELANGCCQLGQIKDIAMRFVVCSAMLSFGGLCVTMQTVSVTSGLGLGQYLPGKLLQCLFSLVLATAAAQALYGTGNKAPLVWLAGAILLLPAVIILRRKKKCVAFQH